MVSTFCDWENLIQFDTAKTAVPGRAIHLTRYIINYLELTCQNKEMLKQVFRDHLKIERADSNDNRSECWLGDGSVQYNARASRRNDRSSRCRSGRSWTCWILTWSRNRGSTRTLPWAPSS